MLNLQEPRRQSRKSILLYVFKNIRGLIGVALYSTFGARALDNWWVVLSLYAIVALLLLVSPLLNYYFFTFHVKADELIIQKGVLNKERKAIPLERIQSVNINQNLIQRLLQIVSVEVETAGSKAKELEIPGLDRSFAESFKNLLQDKAKIKQQQANEEVAITDDEDVSHETPSKPAAANELLTLDIIDLLKVGITQNHLRSGGIALGVTVGFWYNIKDFVEQFYGNVFEGFEWEEIAGYATLSLFVLGVLAFSIFSVLVSMVLVINKYYGYKLQRQGNYLEIEMGLLQRKEIKIPIEKVQILEFHTNPLRRLLNYNTARMFQAQSGSAAITSAEVPACTPAMVTFLQELIFEQPALKDPEQINSFPLSHARLTFYFISIPLLTAVAVAAYYSLYVLSAIALLLYVFLLYKSYRDGAATRILSDDHLVVMQSGWLFHTVRMVPIYKMQAVEKWRSIFLVRRKQIHFNLHTAAGTRGLRYFGENEVIALKNKLNNQVLLSQRYWM